MAKQGEVGDDIDSKVTAQESNQRWSQEFLLNNIFHITFLNLNITWLKKKKKNFLCQHHFSAPHNLVYSVFVSVLVSVASLVLVIGEISHHCHTVSSIECALLSLCASCVFFKSDG